MTKPNFRLEDVQGTTIDLSSLDAQIIILTSLRQIDTPGNERTFCLTNYKCDSDCRCDSDCKKHCYCVRDETRCNCDKDCRWQEYQ